MKTRKLILFTAVLGTLLLAGCLKKDSMNVDPDAAAGSILTLQYLEGGSGTTINSGMQYFSGAGLTYPSSDDADTATYNVNLAGPTTPGSDLNVTIGYDESKLLDNFANDSITYELMPDSLYDFLQTTATIKTGSRAVPLQIAFYPSKIDPTKSYMLPVTVKEAAGKTVSANFGTIYFHVIGNPLAGGISHQWLRWNNATGAGAASFDEVYDDVFAPVNATTISVESGTGTLYLLSFTNSAGALSNFKVKFDPASVTNAGITITSGPTVTLADPVNNKYELTFGYNNSSGAARVIIDKFHR